ncbi:MAG TPA: ATP-binding protein, partial [Conexivisphaerales archaeon]|nr:ATP-binding protein [Conexivisphaerales archaeon]
MSHRNPFIFGDVVTGENFADREKEVKELLSDLRGGTNVLLFSPRRYGKTSLMMEVLRRLDDREFMKIYVDLFPVTSVARFAEVYASAVTKATGGKLEEAVGMIREHIPGFKLVVGPEGVPGVEVEIARTRKDIEEVLDGLYDLPERIAKKKGKEAIVVFDEFQEIANLDGEEIERGLRSRIQHHENAAYVFMGSRRHLLDRMFSDKNKPLYRIGKPFNLGRIPPEEFAAFITGRFVSSGVKVDKGTVEKVLGITGAHPYYTQQLCHELWSVCYEAGHAEGTDLELALKGLMSNQGYAYTTMWESVRGKQRSLLLAMAREGGSNIYSKEFIDRNDLSGPSTVQKAVRYL